MTTPAPETLQRLLAPETVSGLELLQVFAEIDSTNRYLLGQAAPAPGRFHVVLADHQTAGRGRMGRRWCAPPSSSVCLSVAYTFRSPPQNLPSLSLASGVAVVEVLRNLGVHDAALKWPNDIQVGEAKLGGILIETRTAANGNPVAVTGLGLNVDLAGADTRELAPDRVAPITDLQHCLAAVPDRAMLVALLIDALCAAMARFDAQGFAAFMSQWQRYDWLRGRHTIVETASGRISGAADGVDADGALQLVTDAGRRCVRSGSVVLPAPTGTAT